MRIIFIISFLIISSGLSAQTLTFKISGMEDTTMNLVRYFGKGLYYADTAEMKNGVVTFDGSKQKAGMLALFLPGQHRLEFLYNEEDVVIKAKAVNPMSGVIAEKSKENKIFYGYTRFLQKQRQKAMAWSEEMKSETPDSPKYVELQELIGGTSKDVKAYQQNIIDKNWDLLVSRVIKMSMEVEIPEPPVDEAGNLLDSNFRFHYFREHYFDNIDLNDDRLVRTSIFHGKLEGYFAKNMMIQHWDTVVKYAYKFCDPLPAKSEMLQYCVSWITSHFEKSKIMGMDKVFVSMGNRFYRPLDSTGASVANWMPADKLATLLGRVDEIQGLVMGAKPENLILLDSTDTKWHDFYSMESEYTLLYFWDPNCGHCKKVTPKLQTLYEKKFKERGIEIFAVGKAVGEDFEDWKDFIKEHNLTFTNVAVTQSLFKKAKEGLSQAEVLRHTTIESLNYQKTYDVFQSPKVFVLDKDKKIIAKSLSVSQLEEMLDRLQGFDDLVKIFPISEEPEDEQIH
jgi:thiol-disulfide isomerase/thioredoxin